MGLLALMLLIESRRAARTDRRTATSCCWPTRTAAAGTATLIAEGQALVRRCLRRNQPGPYQIQAAINAVHSDAPTAAATDWRQILQLYDQLLALAPSPVVALNRAVAVAEVDGPGRGARPRRRARPRRLPPVPRHPRRPAAAPGPPRRGGAAYSTRIARTDNAAERAHLALAKQHLSSPDSGG